MDEGIIKRFVDEVLQKPSVLVIKANSYAAAPEKPYVTVKLFSDKEQGLPISEVESISATEVNHLVSTYNIATVELQFYSNSNTGEFSAQNLAKYFTTAIGFNRSLDFQKTNGFGVLNVSPKINADIALGDLIERRIVLEFTINYVYTIKDLEVAFFNKDGLRITIEQEL